ncbi:UDP-glucose 4-epimerase family protein [Thauera chlorobenzoica]|uniref:UDP-glucose 4-epimerase n=1 Tax=Thauera chlorobenzoica TaxID=96773 RepID=A0A1H5SWW3_9RHOO|nr:SDR family oxidoreductase [Thauera chlorobenzoica]APR04062.1 UDP-glucose 4-epimerase [Thauera chlorobenzoica]SEF55040.1 UDP-glucose 4-epimerase [Thauera chlorobenzoica]
MSTSLLVTGASGFIGRPLLRRLQAEGRHAVGTARRPPPGSGLQPGPALGPDADWRELLGGREVVVHAAARVHVMNDGAADPLAEFRRVNVDGTLQLARQAARAGVRRFIFISSVKVNGECSPPGRPFCAHDRPAPGDPYALSKHEAEQGLLALSARTGMDVTVIRPPLVHGPGVRANLQTLMHWLARGLPLPLGAIRHNRRSLVGVDNLVDLITTCIDHPAAANRTFMVSDGEDLSTTALLLRLAAAMAVPARLLPVPPWLLTLGGALSGRQAMVRRLCGNLQVDIAPTCAALGWTPPIGVDEGLRRMAAGAGGG